MSHKATPDSLPRMLYKTNRDWKSRERTAAIVSLRSHVSLHPTYSYWSCLDTQHLPILSSDGREAPGTAHYEPPTRTLVRMSSKYSALGLTR